MRRDLLDEHVMHGTIGFPVGIYDVFKESADGVIFTVHYHRELELFIAEKRGIRLQLEGETYDLEAGQGMFINSGILHSTFTSENDFKFLAIVFTPEFISPKNEELYEKYIRPIIKGQVSFPVLLSDEAIGLARGINERFKEKKRGYELYIKSDLTRIMAEIAEASVNIGNYKKDTKTDNIKSTLDFIHMYYQKAITLQDLAEHAHMSREYLCRVFKEVSDISPITYLNRYRIMKSAEMLRNSQKSISETAIECGFNGSSYFNKLFLRFMKCTPGEYRKMYRNTNPN
jgi:AraC-like DNA-binding protein